MRFDSGHAQSAATFSSAPRPPSFSQLFASRPRRRAGVRAAIASSITARVCPSKIVYVFFDQRDWGDLFCRRARRAGNCLGTRTS